MNTLYFPNGANIKITNISNEQLFTTKEGIISPTLVPLKNVIDNQTPFTIQIPSFVSYKINSILPGDSITFIVKDIDEIMYYKKFAESNIKGIKIEVTPIEEKAVIYGWHVDPSISDPDNAITYLEKAVDKTPAQMTNDGFSYGDWEDAFFMPKPCMVKYDGTVDYYLDPNDYTKKIDGTDSDVADPNYNGNAMMEWPKIWFKFEEGNAEGEGYFYCSSEKVDDTYDCFCNIDSLNNEIDHFYTAIYNGTGIDKMRSISGVQANDTNGCGYQTFATQEANAKANNTTTNVEWYMEVWADRMLINALLILISKSLNSQAKFGNGLVTNVGEYYITGTLNNKGLFWGDTTNLNQAVKIFGMENWWGHTGHRIAGLVNSYRTKKYLYKMTYNNYDGSEATSYNSDGYKYLTAKNKAGVDLILPAKNYLTKCNYGTYGYLPITTSSGSGNTYYCDSFYANSSDSCVMTAGGWTAHKLQAGASYFNLNIWPHQSVWYVAASLSLKPIANV